MARSRFADDVHRRGRSQDPDDMRFDIDVDFDPGGGRKGREPDLDIDVRCKGNGIDLDIDVDRKGKWLDVEIEIGKFDIDLKLDARQLRPDNEPMTTLAGGDATAVGEETLVDADIFARLLDLGSVTVAFGTSTFKSVAVSGEDGAFATASTFADVSGADFVFIFNTKTSTGGSTSDTTFALETSTTTYIAIDFEDFDFAEGQLTFDFGEAQAYLAGGCGRCSTGKTPDIDGNVSMLDVDALASAQNTIVDVLSSILTIEAQLSSVSAMAITAGG